MIDIKNKLVSLELLKYYYDYHRLEMQKKFDKIKAGTEATAEWHLGFYLDENGDLCQKEDE